MPKLEISRHYGLPAALAALVALLFWMLNTGFVSQREYDRDINRIEAKLDCALWDLPRGCRDTMYPRQP